MGVFSQTRGDAEGIRITGDPTVVRDEDFFYNKMVAERQKIKLAIDRKKKRSEDLTKKREEGFQTHINGANEERLQFRRLQSQVETRPSRVRGLAPIVGSCKVLTPAPANGSHLGLGRGHQQAASSSSSSTGLALGPNPMSVESAFTGSTTGGESEVLGGFSPPTTASSDKNPSNYFEGVLPIMQQANDLPGGLGPVSLSALGAGASSSSSAAPVNKWGVGGHGNNNNRGWQKETIELRAEDGRVIKLSPTGEVVVEQENESSSCCTRQESQELQGQDQGQDEADDALGDKNVVEVLTMLETAPREALEKVRESLRASKEVSRADLRAAVRPPAMGIESKSEGIATSSLQSTAVEVNALHLVGGPPEPSAIHPSPSASPTIAASAGIKLHDVPILRTSTEQIIKSSLQHRSLEMLNTNPFASAGAATPASASSSSSSSTGVPSMNLATAMAAENFAFADEQRPRSSRQVVSKLPTTEEAAQAYRPPSALGSRRTPRETVEDDLSRQGGDQPVLLNPELFPPTAAGASSTTIPATGIEQVFSASSLRSNSTTTGQEAAPYRSLPVSRSSSRARSLSRQVEHLVERVADLDGPRQRALERLLDCWDENCAVIEQRWDWREGEHQQDEKAVVVGRGIAILPRDSSTSSSKKDEEDSTILGTVPQVHQHGCCYSKKGGDSSARGGGSRGGSKRGSGEFADGVVPGATDAGATSGAGARGGSGPGGGGGNNNGGSNSGQTEGEQGNTQMGLVESGGRAEERAHITVHVLRNHGAPHEVEIASLTVIDKQGNQLPVVPTTISCSGLTSGGNNVHKLFSNNSGEQGGGKTTASGGSRPSSKSSSSSKPSSRPSSRQMSASGRPSKGFAPTTAWKCKTASADGEFLLNFEVNMAAGRGASTTKRAADHGDEPELEVHAVQMWNGAGKRSVRDIEVTAQWASAIERLPGVSDFLVSKSKKIRELPMTMKKKKAGEGSPSTAKSPNRGASDAAAYTLLVFDGNEDDDALPSASVASSAAGVAASSGSGDQQPGVDESAGNASRGPSRGGAPSTERHNLGLGATTTESAEDASKPVWLLSPLEIGLRGPPVVTADYVDPDSPTLPRGDRDTMEFPSSGPGLGGSKCRGTTIEAETSREVSTSRQGTAFAEQAQQGGRPSASSNTTDFILGGVVLPGGSDQTQRENTKGTHETASPSMPAKKRKKRNRNQKLMDSFDALEKFSTSASRRFFDQTGSSFGGDLQSSGTGSPTLTTLTSGSPGAGKAKGADNNYEFSFDAIEQASNAGGDLEKDLEVAFATNLDSGISGAQGGQPSGAPATSTTSQPRKRRSIAATDSQNATTTDSKNTHSNSSSDTEFQHVEAAKAEATTSPGQYKNAQLNSILNANDGQPGLTIEGNTAATSLQEVINFSHASAAVMSEMLLRDDARTRGQSLLSSPRHVYNASFAPRPTTIVQPGHYVGRFRLRRTSWHRNIWRRRSIDPLAQRPYTSKSGSSKYQCSSERRKRSTDGG
ncbi:unnamed protein product [Amoebophrya sp. A25]|nr:unnamed protein product [Amoebophrya sp. A25]|eukprot:GSA25T00009710001.1